MDAARRSKKRLLTKQPALARLSEEPEVGEDHVVAKPRVAAGTQSKTTVAFKLWQRKSKKPSAEKQREDVNQTLLDREKKTGVPLRDMDNGIAGLNITGEVCFMRESPFRILKVRELLPSCRGPSRVLSGSRPFWVWVSS